MSRHESGTGATSDADAGRPAAAPRVAQIYALFARGASIEEVAGRAGMTPERVLELLGRHGLDREVAAEAVALRRESREALEGEVRHLHESLGDDRAVAARLALPIDTVRSILASGPQDRGAATRYSDQELIGCLREVTDELGGPLTRTDYNRVARLRGLEDGRPWPTAKDQCERFGSWKIAHERAGLKLLPRLAVRMAPVTPEQCIAAVREVAEVLGWAPTRAEYEERAKRSIGAIPRGGTVNKRCGRWPEVLRRAGLSAP